MSRRFIKMARTTRTKTIIQNTSHPLIVAFLLWHHLDRSNAKFPVLLLEQLTNQPLDQIDGFVDCHRDAWAKTHQTFLLVAERLGLAADYQDSSAAPSERLDQSQYFGGVEI